MTANNKFFIHILTAPITQNLKIVLLRYTVIISNLHCNAVIDKLNERTKYLGLQNVTVFMGNNKS